MRNLALLLSFNGSKYHGWQRQKNAVTVEETLSNAIYKITGEQASIIGCSRTDAGVHALGYVCNFKSNTKIPTEKLPLALNTALPNDIRTLKCKRVADDFHSRFCAVSKTYIYKVYSDVISNPLLKDFVYHFPYELNYSKMERATLPFIGTHDFSAFMSSGSSQVTTVREVIDFHVSKENNHFNFEITANAFLYNMVRIIIGTVLYVGIGKIQLQDIEQIIACRDRKRSGITAGPEGLYLSSVKYNE
ncbi:MAG: tRNA pseudouridine(38-40) synthase TruA [Clostridiaceae bacterium]|nr:tRNA pseudouridine(38-40) synthase TruA [Clostridiaceae bacterium]